MRPRQVADELLDFASFKRVEGDLLIVGLLRPVRPILGRNLTSTSVHVVNRSSMPAGSMLAVLLR